MNDLTPLVQEARDDFERAHAPADLENAKARYLGKAGRITEQLKALGALPPDEKKARGALINEAKQAIEAALNARREALADAELQAQLRGEALDVSLPGRRRGTGGGLHPISRARERIEAIFGSMGFDVADGPEIETDWYSFTALKLRFRPSYFPFTEPSAEIDLMFETGPLAGRWLEISGSGQVHPQVIRNMGLDPEKHIGFAFGSGIDRLAMLRYGISDLRLFFENDLRFLAQFN